MQCTSCGTALQAGVSTCPNCGTPVATLQPVPSHEKAPSFYDEYIPFTDQETPPPAPLVPPEPSLQAIEPEETPPGAPVASPPARRIPLLALTTTLSIVSLLVIIVLVVLLIHNATQNSAAKTPLNQFSTSDPQAIYTQATTKIPVVNDAFSSKSSTWKSTGIGSCTVSGNSLHVTAPQGNNVLCTSTTFSVSNFACQVQITLAQGDTTGLIFRANPTSKKSYVIELTSQGTYLLGTGQSGTSTFKVLAEGISSTINGASGQSNLLTIIALGTILYLYINKQFIVSTSDPSSSSGLIGVASGGTLTNIAVDATFSHFQIWKL